jgi:ABC-2 type transport system ATP-binding protein
MQHAERLCDRLLLIARGRKLFEGTQAEARATLPQHLTLITRDHPADLPYVIHAAAGTRQDDWTEWDITLASGADPAGVLQACGERGIILRKFDTNPARLHDIFVHLVNLDRAEATP